MKFKNVTETENGELYFDVETTKDEVAYLVNYAVNDLLGQGILHISHNPTEEVQLPQVSH